MTEYKTQRKFSRARNFLLSPELLIFLSTFLIYIFTANKLWTDDHTTSSMYLEYAMWSNHSFALGKVGDFTPHSVDTFLYHCYYYSALAPGLELLAYPFASFGFIIDGGFALYGFGLLFTEAFLGLANSLASVFLYKLARLYFQKPASVFISFSYAFASISWPFATMAFQHDLSAFFAVVGAYYIMTHSRSTSETWRLLLAGLSAGLAATSDYVVGILIPIFGIYILLTLKQSKGKVFLAFLVFIASSIVGLLGLAIYNLESFGNVFVSSEQLFLSNGSLLGNFRFPIWAGISLNSFSPYRGLVFYAPLVVAGAFGFENMLRSKVLRKNAIFFLAISMGIILPYSAWYDPTGGLSFGPRFLVPAIPFLILPAGRMLENGTRRTKIATYALYCFGSLGNGIGALTSALGSYGNGPYPTYFTWILLVYNFPQFTKGMLDSWWFFFLGAYSSYWYLPAIAILAFSLVIPFLYIRLGNRRIPGDNQKPR